MRFLRATAAGRCIFAAMASSLRPLVLLGVVLVGCGKSAQEKAADVVACTATEHAAAAIAKCLREENGWRQGAADSAGLAQAQEMESVRAELQVMAVRADTQHTGEIHACDRVLVDLKTCLITRYGWEEDRATAADDSLWNSRATDHQRQIRACLGRRAVGTGACLQLHYKWQPRRALALDDSIRRANINR